MACMDDRPAVDLSGAHDGDARSSAARAMHQHDTISDLLRAIGRLEGHVHHVANAIDRVERSVEQTAAKLERKVNEIEQRVEKHDRWFFRLATIATIGASTITMLLNALVNSKLIKLLLGQFNG